METIINLNQPRKPKGTRRRAGRGPTEAKAPVTPEYAQACRGGQSRPRPLNIWQLAIKKGPT